MIPYILHVTVITTICFLFYKLLLQKETFYQLNRWTLLGCLVVSFSLPLLPVPRAWSWQDKWRDKEGASTAAEVKLATAPIASTAVRVASVQVPVNQQSLQAFSRRPHAKRKHQAGSRTMDDVYLPARKTNVSAGEAAVQTTGTTAGTPVVKSEAPDRAQANVASRSRTGEAASRTPMTTGELVLLAVQWLFYCYLFGVVLFGANFLSQLAVLLYQSYSRPVIRDGRFRIVEVGGNRAPCSFGNTIFINPENYDWETFNQILIHEKIHVSGRHTLDILLAEIAVVVQWFNPFVWLYRREVENNLEFLTDAHVLLHREVERSSYQLSLLRVSAPHLSWSLTNNYNQSLLKRRIVMMNSQRSSFHTIWKYFFLIPLLAALVCVLNKPAEASGTAKKSFSANNGGVADDHTALITLGRILPLFSGHAVTMVRDTSRHPVKRDTAAAVRPSNRRDESSDDWNYITPPEPPIPAIAYSIDATPYVDPYVAVAPRMSFDVSPKVALEPRMSIDWAPQAGIRPKMAIQPNIAVDVTPLPPMIPKGLMGFPADSELRDGSWFVTSYNDKLDFELRAADEDHSWSTTLHVDKSEINPFPGQGNVEFKLVREAGTVTFKGQFDGQEGFGHFHFDPDDSYFSALKQIGVEDLEDRRRFGFFAMNVKKDYAKSIVISGFPHISQRDLIRFSAMHIDPAFIQYWHGSGLVDADDPRTLTTLKALKIDRAYVDELKEAGYDHLSLRELESMKAQHIDRAYIRSLGHDRDNGPIPVRELITYKAMRVDSGYLEGLRKAGYTNLEPREVSKLYAMHVTPEYIQGLAAVGYKDLDARQLGNLRAMNITPEFIRSWADLGYSDLNSRDLGSLKAMNITPEFVKGFKEIGFDHIPVHLLYQLKAAGVDADYVAKMRKQGFNSNDLMKYIRLKTDFN
jgi:bla regulator protein blaR1